MNPGNSALLFLVSAPSGAGKTTLCSGLLAADPRLSRVITCTTRPPRAGETDGVDYHFLTPAEFERQVADGAFLEHAEVYANRYGTRRRDVVGRLRSGGDVLLTVDVQGVASIRVAAASDPELASALVTVFVTPATRRELEERLRGRAADSDEVIRRRLAAADGEVAAAAGFDYLIVSGTREEDFSRARAILDAERCRTRRVRLDFDVEAAR